MNPYDLIKRYEQLHQDYCIKGSVFMAKLNHIFDEPGIVYIAKPIRRAGRALLREGGCEYNLAYLLNENNDYEQTIAHEVAHHVSWQLDGSYAYHGDAWRLVLGKVFGRSTNVYHKMEHTELSVHFGQSLVKLENMRRLVKPYEVDSLEQSKVAEMEEIK